MKTKIKFLLFAFVSIITFSFITVSCSDDDGDTTPPVINLSTPAEGASVQIGHDISFDALFSDDEMLASYKVEIHNNFNNHPHSVVLRDASETSPFFFQKSWNISGQKSAKIHHHEIVIPEQSTPGAYHLMVYCTDAAGNESYIARNIILTHDEVEDDHHH